ncbi:preprotein translocase subunit SecE [Alicyclobacillus cycloheptanicus]|uniref:Protein translocase subunit SecE n=1 Tax=Alicyclobacillus cycloheptanicus TaxID=1457 RepID=A0ABT9XJ95_9BACL|nr:preprotein translocase subunit SecE [Alicyclobacillus cycloheptanicus]MDQ0190389.1 preprotein translocase subunit SecE [Alicyclobacillus cycloheptanicus]WDM02630.1 preprotein translocase subunit SecE [Alicyclobacillus cycloheptanicus]
MEKSKPTVVRNLSDAKQNTGESNRRSGPVAFIRETFWELKRVRWPRRKEVVNYTAAALIMCALMGVLVWAFDIGVAKVLSLIGLV